MDTRKMNGTYKARAVDGGLGETSTGKEQIAILFEVLAEGEFKGARLTYYGYFTDGTIESTIKGLRACGWAGTDLSELLDFKKSNLAANEVELVIEPEQGQRDGKPEVDEKGEPVMRARIRWINALARIGLKAALTVDKAAAFAARMKGRLLAFDQASKTKTNGAPASTPPAAPAPVVDPGDIPF